MTSAQIYHRGPGGGPGSGHDPQDDPSDVRQDASHFRPLPPIMEYEYFSGEGLGGGGGVGVGPGSGHGMTDDFGLAHASNSDLAFEWSMLCQDCTDCWTGTGKMKKITYLDDQISAKIMKKSNLT